MEEKKLTTEEKPETLPAEVRANMLSAERSIFFNVALFEQAQRVAKMFSDSTMVPTHFRGNLGNCMIALNYAARIQADPFMVFQSLYEVKGRPGIEGKLVEAIINSSNKYSEPLQYVWLDPQDKPVERHIVLNHKDFAEFGCQAFTIDAKSGQRIDGPKITWQLVQLEGWNKDSKIHKTGEIIKSKWNTMPEMMFYYRAASWFGNKNCPELKLGMHTVEELHEITDLSKQPNGTYAAAMDLNEKLKPTNGKKETGGDPYEAKEKPDEPEKKEEEKKEAYETMSNLKFKKWCKKERNTIPGMDGWHQAKIYKRWENDCPSEDFPVPDEPPVEDNQGGSEENHPTDIEAMLALVDGAQVIDGEFVVPCPDRGAEVQMLQDKCNGIGFDRCESRDGCPTWVAWDNRDKG